MPAFTQEYAASVDLVVTNLQGLASSSTYLDGWTSASIDNTANKYLDQIVTGKLTTAASNMQAGELRLYAYAMFDDANWPDLFSAGTEGTEGVATIHDTEIRDSGLVLLWGATTDAYASNAYTIPPQSLRAAFGGTLPPKYALFLTGNATTGTTAQLAASGNKFATKGAYIASA